MSERRPRPEKRVLTITEIIEVRSRYQSEDPKPTIDRLAQLYHVSPNTMWRILRSPLEPAQLGR